MMGYTLCKPSPPPPPPCRSYSRHPIISHGIPSRYGDRTCHRRGEEGGKNEDEDESEDEDEVAWML